MMTSRGGIIPSTRAVVPADWSRAVADGESVAPQAAPDAMIATAEIEIRRVSARFRAAARSGVDDVGGTKFTSAEWGGVSRLNGQGASHSVDCHSQ
jgi:hypothetical protein